MTAPGDVLAILGLFERVAVELRDYKDAPAHFQHLSVELNLLCSTLRHAIQLRPDNDDERQVLSKVGAIATHCLQPLQAMVDKMRSKERSLGHFRTTRSLVNIGTRLHWSLIDRKDVDELRKVVLAEMVAINMLLTAQQLSQIKLLSVELKKTQNAQSALIDRHSTALIQQTSSIFKIVAATPNAIADLRTLTVEHAAKQSMEGRALQRGMEAAMKHVEALSLTVKQSWKGAQRRAAAMDRMVKRLSALMGDIRELFRFLATCSKEMLAAIGRNTRLLLHIANQMKRVVETLEAMPRGLGVDIVRLDDALGETWGLPLQACESWNSFCDMLRLVVFAGKPGLDRVVSRQFVITMARTGVRLGAWNWDECIKRDIHLEQAMMLPPPESKSKGCPFPGCTGTILLGDNVGNTCSTCGRQSKTRKEITSVAKLEERLWPRPSVEAPPSMLQRSHENSLPQLRLPTDDSRHFRRIEIQEPVEPVQDMEEAVRRLKHDETDATANAFVGLEALKLAEESLDRDHAVRVQYFDEAVRRLKTAIDSESSVAEHWYLLGRAYRGVESFTKAYEAFQQAAIQNRHIPNFWITIGVLYYRVRQLQDSLGSLRRAVSLNPYMYVCWYNIGVLYEAENKPLDAVDPFQRCLELAHRNLPTVEARLQVLLECRENDATPRGERILEMIDTELGPSLESGNYAEDRVFSPLLALSERPGPRLVKPQEFDRYSGYGDADSDSDWEDASEEDQSDDEDLNNLDEDVDDGHDSDDHS